MQTKSRSEEDDSCFHLKAFLKCLQQSLINLQAQQSEPGLTCQYLLPGQYHLKHALEDFAFGGTQNARKTPL